MGEPTLKYAVSLEVPNTWSGEDMTDDLYKAAELLADSLKDGSNLVEPPVVEDKNIVSFGVEHYS